MRTFVQSRYSNDGQSNLVKGFVACISRLGVVHKLHFRPLDPPSTFQFIPFFLTLKRSTIFFFLLLLFFFCRLYVYPSVCMTIYSTTEDGHDKPLNCCDSTKNSTQNTWKHKNSLASWISSFLVTRDVCFKIPFFRSERIEKERNLIVLCNKYWHDSFQNFQMLLVHSFASLLVFVMLWIPENVSSYTIEIS